MSSSNGASAAGSSSTHLFHNLGSLGLGYAIAIAFAFLIILSVLSLAFYMCRRATRNSAPFPNPNPSNPRLNGVVVPRTIFVVEDDSDDDDDTVRGLDPSVINSYPKFPFSSKDRNGDGNSICSICLCDYRDGEMLRLLPDCRHFFHVSCIDAWLRLNTSCPVCRTSPLPTPMSTPLSELVPLSRYSADRRR